jgi:DNA-binding XRE family transcriptional regulator
VTSFEGDAAVAVAIGRRGHKTHLLRVKAIRQWFGLTQEELAQVLGVSRATVIRWEEANSGPVATSAAGRVLNILVETQRLAGRTFHRPENAQRWLRTNVPALHATPIETLVTRGPLPVRDVLLEGLEGVMS